MLPIAVRRRRRRFASSLRMGALAVVLTTPAYGAPGAAASTSGSGKSAAQPPASKPGKKSAASGKSGSAQPPASKPGKKPAASGPEAQRRADARRHFEAGAKAYASGDYPDAIDQFLEANRLVPSPALSYNIARAYDRIGNAAQALRFYRDYLRRAPDASDKKSVAATIDALETKLMNKGVQQVTVLSTPSRATVVMDGQPVGVTTWTGELYPGHHRITLRLEGYRDTQKVFNLPAHRAIDVRVQLSRKKKIAAAAPVRPPPAAPEPSAAPPAGHAGGAHVAPWTWAALGVGVASLGASLGFELARASAARQSRDAPTQVEAASRYDTMKSRQTIARVLLGVGAAATVAGGVLLYLDLTHDKSGEVSGRVGLGCAGAGCGVVAGTVF